MTEPNSNAVWIALIQMVGTAFAVWLAYRQTRKSTKEDAKEVKAELAVVQQKAEVREEKLDAVHSLVNGDRAAKEARIQALESKLRDHGIAE
jgi:predicted histidine transporter YuiF (NhaC family)